MPRGRLPLWMKQNLPPLEETTPRDIIKSGELLTVCTEALCPNRGHCFSQGSATFLLMGPFCTRACLYCSVKKGETQKLSEDEPRRVALAVKEMALKHAVITSVTRDDLEDGGASHLASTIYEIKKINPETTVELLTPDLQGSFSSLDLLLDAPLAVINHNIETVRDLFPELRPGGSYSRSLKIIEHCASRSGSPTIKSGFMVGLGENNNQIRELLEDLYRSGAEVVTIGQYLPPTRKHIYPQRFVSPEEFNLFKDWGLYIGFKEVLSGPFVRSSLNAIKTVDFLKN